MAQSRRLKMSFNGVTSTTEFMIKLLQLTFGTDFKNSDDDKECVMKKCNDKPNTFRIVSLNTEELNSD